MTEPRRSVWGALADEWDPDHPAIARMREALALKPVEEAQPPTPKAKTAVSPEPTPEPVTAGSPSRRERIGALVERVKSGDLSPVAMLRELLDR